MALIASLLGALLVLATLIDAFEVVLLPRPVRRRVRLNRYFFKSTWDLWSQYDAKRWKETLERETSGFEPISAIGRTLEKSWAARKEVPMEELRRALRTLTPVCYQLLWTSCSRSEKLVLVQLAQERLVNPKSRETVEELIAKGLIIDGAVPMLFNLTFRDFLQRIERDDVVQEWERMEGVGLWVIAWQSVASVLIVGGALYLITQGIAAQNVVPILSGSGLLGAPFLKDMVSRFAGKVTPTTAGSA